MRTMKPIYRHKRNQRRLLAPWRRGSADLEGLKPGGQIEGHLAAGRRARHLPLSLKMRFAKWHNWRKGRDGCLWSQKLRSVLVEGGLAAQTVVAYIDMNPVRAGIVEDPKD